MNYTRVYVCSPLRPLNGFTIEDNIEYAKKLCAAAVRAGYAAWASHVFYPLFLDDSKQAERDMGMQSGLAWLRAAKEVWIAADGPDDCTEGMLKEVAYARALPDVPLFLWAPYEWRGLMEERVRLQLERGA